MLGILLVVSQVKDGLPVVSLFKHSLRSSLQPFLCALGVPDLYKVDAMCWLSFYSAKCLGSIDSDLDVLFNNLQFRVVPPGVGVGAESHRADIQDILQVPTEASAQLTPSQVDLLQPFKIC